MPERFVIKVRVGRLAFTAGSGGEIYRFTSRREAIEAIANGWSQYGAAWKRKHLRIELADD